jgi:hypothetical protein
MTPNSIQRVRREYVALGPIGRVSLIGSVIQPVVPPLGRISTPGGWDSQSHKAPGNLFSSSQQWSPQYAFNSTMALSTVSG